MGNFDIFIDRVLGNEGGYVYNINDPGGETNWGISKRAYPDVNIKTLTKEDAKKIYYRDFWQRIDGDNLPNEVAYQTLDAAVNHGVGNAIRMLQRAIGVHDDGNFGPLSRAALSRLPPVDCVLRFNAERIDFYTSLSNFQVFGKGWMRRISANLRFAVDDE